VSFQGPRQDLVGALVRSHSNARALQTPHSHDPKLTRRSPLVPLAAKRSCRWRRACRLNPRPHHTHTHAPARPCTGQAAGRVADKGYAAYPPTPPTLPTPLTFFALALFQSAISRTPPSRLPRPTTRRGTTCAPSSWPRCDRLQPSLATALALSTFPFLCRPRPGLRRAWSRSSPRPAATTMPSSRPPSSRQGQNTNSPCALALSPTLTLSHPFPIPGGARDRAPNRPHGPHVFRVRGRQLQRALLAAR